MDDVCAVACPVMAGSGSIAAERDASRSLLRWVVLGAASLVLVVLAIMQSGSVGAQAPIYVTPGTTVGTTTATNTTTGLPPNTIVSTYVDPRYCGGVVSVATDSSGHLIDVCPITGQRFIPVFPDFGFNFAPGFIGANFATPAFFNGNFVNGFNGNFVNGFNGFNCTFGFNCTNVFPAGGTVVGGAVFYNDNRFCTDGKLVFIPNRGYFCQNGGPLVPNGVTTVNCGNFFFDGCGIFRPFAAEATPAPAAATQPVTTFAAPAAKAPVAPAAVAAPAAVVAPAAPVVAKVAAPLAVTVPAAPIAPAAPVVAKVAAPAAVVAPVVDPDDHKG